MTHADLVTLAVRWLRITKRCHIVISETNAGGQGETPDAIGWGSAGFSIVVECKVSLEDLRRDRQKPHNQDHRFRMGDRRYILTPPGLVEAPDVPRDHGLLWPNPSGRRPMKVIKEAPPLDAYALAEVRLLVAEFRRVMLGVRQPFDTCGVAPGQRARLEMRSARETEWGTPGYQLLELRALSESKLRNSASGEQFQEDSSLPFGSDETPNEAEQ